MKNFVQDFVLKIMAIDSTTGSEAKLVDYLAKKSKPKGATIKIQKASRTQKNLFFKWGKPKIIFCTHLDTVAPFIPPSQKNGVIHGRGACDAKGQIAAMYQTCKELYQEGQNNFGLLLVSDEEKGSKGAKIANKIIKGTKYTIIGEPTNNKLISASKGTTLIKVTATGKEAHSGYPENGKSAVKELQQFFNKLDKIKFPVDHKLGKTTYNISLLKTSNPLNVMPKLAACKILFRTTFASYQDIEKKIKKNLNRNLKLEIISSSKPMEFFTVPGFKTGYVAFGSDAPHLSNLGKRLLYGPGNILNAHTENEHIKISDLKKSVKELKKLFHTLRKIDN
jgi:acetylornithine deacetylase